MICWSAAEMPRQGVRLWGLTPWTEKAAVVIYCGNHVGLYYPLVLQKYDEQIGQGSQWEV